MIKIAIGRNEAPHIRPLVESIGRDRTMLVLDRPELPGDEAEAALTGAAYIVNRSGEGRLTSTARDIGYCVARSLWGADDALFLDMDRYPVSGTLDGLGQSGADVECLFLEDDLRVDEKGGPVVFPGEVHSGFFSCGLWFRKGALEAIEKFYAADRGAWGGSVVFPRPVERFWGVEDTLLGDVCFHLGLSIAPYTGCRLRGAFEKTRVDTLDAVEARFRLRDKLNVRW
jgi:hypothetical protein